MNGILELVHNLDPGWIYLLLVLITFGENIFPPFPGDVILLFCGYLSGIGRANWLILLVFAYVGSITGFMLLYAIGKGLDNHLIQSRKWRWLPYKSIDTIEGWFDRWGALIIVISRYLMGVRCAIALFSGMAEVNRGVTFLCATIGVLTWNAILVLSGKWLGDNWQAVQRLLSQYQRVVIVVILISVLGFLGHAVIKRLVISRT